MWNNMSRALKEALSPYDNTPSDEVWDRSMIAKAIDAYEQMQNISSNELNVYVNNLANTLQIYVSRYRSELSEQMNSAEVAVKFGQLRMLFEDRGTLDIDYSRRDFMMYRMYRVQNERFQEYLNAFNANFENMDTENDEGNEGGEDGENYENDENMETIEYREPNSDVLTTTPLSSKLDIYETAKLVELRSRFYKHNELRELSKLMEDYAARRGIDDTERLRMVSSLNSRMKYIASLLDGEDRDDALPMEREVARLYRENRAEFDKVIMKANSLFEITPVESPVAPAAVPETFNDEPPKNYTPLKERCRL